MNDNVVKHDWGMEITWCKQDTYCGKILVFNKAKDATPFSFSKDIQKSYFINSGEFKIRWIDTKTGQIFEQVLKEGSVHTVEPLVPVSIISLQDGSTIMQASSGDDFEDRHIVLPANRMI
jgi:hypothetical protein